jgi:hypothetical protein
LEKAFYTEPLGVEGRYALGLDDNPLAYLTTLADMLQDWDRHSFGRIKFGEDTRDPLAASEVVIKFSPRNRLQVIPLSRGARERYKELTGPDGFGIFMPGWEKYVELDDSSFDR